jgi:hypothetical protein
LLLNAAQFQQRYLLRCFSIETRIPERLGKIYFSRQTTYFIEPTNKITSHNLIKWLSIRFWAASGLFPLIAMPVLQIGQTSISYTVRYSSRTKRQHIVVTPEAVEVVAPTDTPQEQIAAFLDRIFS